jgi:uncharacterized protein (DUF1697 family)
VPTYVALLRGINLGSTRRVAMADLRALLEELGCTDVRTLLQSGNAVLTTPTRSARAVGKDIEAAISGRLGMDVRVVVRTPAELAAIVAADPLGEQVSDHSRAMVLFCERKVPAAAAAALRTADVAPDVVVVEGREVYLWMPEGLHRARAPRAVERADLGPAAKMRNWRTVTRLAEMAGA